ncbi:unnamed protein product [Linum trigynum]|uniref:Uncharacterized protein n=1 Tax=Linum trigynum TaxID=586398 RepID=A0AAV2E5R5_9ROSI
MRPWRRRAERIFRPAVVPATNFFRLGDVRAAIFFRPAVFFAGKLAGKSKLTCFPTIEGDGRLADDGRTVPATDD